MLADFVTPLKGKIADKMEFLAEIYIVFLQGLTKAKKALTVGVC